MANIEIYTKDWCGYSGRAKSLLKAKELDYVEFDVTHDRELETEMRNRSGRHSVPQIFVDGYHIGGFDDLSAANHNGHLDSLTADNSISELSSVNGRLREPILSSTPV
jgi:glutaredoxin 3